jgi:hypothetical protein
MERVRFLSFAAAAAAFCLAGAGSTSAASPVSGPAIEHWNGAAWTPVASPQLSGTLDGVAVISATNAWAVGRRETALLAEHWNGSSWRQVAVPAPTRRGHGELYAVAGSSAADVWAVGYWNRQSLIEHWDGAHWKRVPSPSPRSASYLLGVSALSARNAWAVGWYADDKTRSMKTLVLHWNGSRWLRVSSPNPGSTGTQRKDQLSAVTAVSASDIWAVGNFVARQGTGFHGARTLTLHWDGKRWTHVTSPTPETRWSHPLLDVASAGAKDVWAVGVHQTGHGTVPLVERWDGTSWSIVPAPAANASAPVSYQELNGVAVVSGRDAWTVGNYSEGPDTSALVEHWVGSSWTRVPLADPGRVGTLSGVAALSSNDIWAVGQYGNP